MLSFLGRASLQLTKIGTIANYCSSGFPYAFALGNDLVLSYFDYINDNLFFERINKNGQVCYYSNIPRFAPNFAIDTRNNSTCIYLGGQNVLLNNGGGGSAFVTLPTYFQSEFWGIVKPTIQNIQSPCGQGTLFATYYGSGMAAYEFADNHPVSQNYWASFYKSGVNGLSLIGGGYLGNFPSNTDPLRITNGTAPILSGFSQQQLQSGYWYNNGSQIIYSSQVVPYGTHKAFGVSKTKLIYNPLTCGNAAPVLPYFTTEYGNEILYSAMPSTDSDNLLTESPCNGYINSPGAAFQPCNATAYVLGPGGMIALDYNVNLLQPCGMLNMQTGDVILVNEAAGTAYRDIYTGNVGASLNPSFPSMAGAQVHLLVNNSRPVSIVGAFRT